MACSPYVPPVSTAITALLAPGYTPPLNTAINAVLDPCNGSAPTVVQLYKVVVVSFGQSTRRDPRAVDSAWRPTPKRESGADSRWRGASVKAAAVHASWSPNFRADLGVRGGWGTSVASGGVLAVDWSQVFRRDLERSLDWSPTSKRLDAKDVVPWHRVYARDLDGDLRWDQAQLPGTYVQPETGLPYTPPPGGAIHAVLVAGYTPPLQGQVVATLVVPGAAPAYVAVRQDPAARRFQWGQVPIKEAGTDIAWGPHGNYGGRDPIVGLPWINQPPTPPPQPPALKVHLVMNNVTVVRLPDMAPIEVLGVDLSANVDTWCWSVRMELADPSQLALLLPDGNGPRMVQITMNTYVWTAIIEGRERSRGFGQATVTVAGRSRSALLDSPYAPRRSGAESNPRTGRQLAEGELTNTGFTLDWAGTDWLVPGGAWYYSDMTPAAVLQDIASAAGAVLQSHPSNASLSVKPRYSTAPWGWSAATADLILPASWVVEDSTQYASKPMYDAVFVRGEQQGVQSRITRQGSAGETFAEQVVHKLITHADVSVQRGITALGDRGEQELVDVKIPLFVPGTETGGASGLFLPLNLVEVQDLASSWRGLSVGVSISARRSGERNAALEVWQNVSLERHLTDAG